MLNEGQEKSNSAILILTAALILNFYFFNRRFGGKVEVLKNVFIVFICLIIFSSLKVNALEKCKWDNRKGIPCVVIKKTPNSSAYNEENINKIVITKQNIINSGAQDTNDILKLISGLDVFQSGPKGQSTSIFTRGSESNHTLVLLNGVAINDQSTTDGLHDFGQDFVHTIQQIEIYKGSNGAHFGPSAIAGAINFITDIDYTNSYSISGFNSDNNSLDGNFTKITNNGWHLNLKGGATQNKTDSSIAKGNEDDGMKNYQLNLNANRWLNENLKFKSTLYSRQTKADYDGSATNEIGYVSDNKMYAVQTGFEYNTKDTENNLIFHYQNYDREYENGGYLDEYYSESLVAKGERKVIANEKFSFGYGAEYKYDWGNFEDRGSYSASTKGHMKDLGFFSNLGFKINENQIFSIYGRTDDHNTTGTNETYKFSFTRIFEDFKFIATHSTGLRNPSLYELYGSNSSGYSGNTKIAPEKSKTNELYGEYFFSENLKLSSTAYRTSIFDRIEQNSSWTSVENKKSDINQEGLESELFLKYGDNSYSFFTHFAKSRSATEGPQSRRPDLSYGLNYSKEINTSLYGPLNLYLNYKYTGDYIDWDGSKNSFQKSTDIVDLSIKKKWFNNIMAINFTNLLNERYEKPATYSQDGRQLRLKITSLF